MKVGNVDILATMRLRAFWRHTGRLWLEEEKQANVRSCGTVKPRRELWGSGSRGMGGQEDLEVWCNINQTDV